MKYIITGATSFIGSELCKYLLDNHHEVVAVCREGSSEIANLPKEDGLSIVYASMIEYRTLPDKITDANVFVNLAWAATGHEGRDQVEAQWKNVEHSIDALIAARLIGCKLFVEAGSQAEYGLTDEVQTPESETNPFSEYGKAKLAMKDMAFAYCRMTGMKYLHLRIFSTYGEKDKNWTLVSTCIDKMLKNEPIELSPCTQNWNFVYVKDAAKQIALLSKYAIEKVDYDQDIFHIASEDTRILRDFVLEMKQLTGSTSILHFGAVNPERLVSLQPDLAKTKSTIDFVSDYTFADGIKRIIDNIIKKVNNDKG